MLGRCKVAASDGSDAGPFLGDSGQDAQPVGRGYYRPLRTVFKW